MLNVCSTKLLSSVHTTHMFVYKRKNTFKLTFYYTLASYRIFSSFLLLLYKCKHAFRFEYNKWYRRALHSMLDINSETLIFNQRTFSFSFFLVFYCHLDKRSHNEPFFIPVFPFVILS